MAEARSQSADAGSVVVRLPGALVDLFPGASRSARLPPGTVAEMIDGLDGLWPGMGARIRDERPAVRRHINIFVDGERAELETRLEPGAEVYVLMAISGG